MISEAPKTHRIVFEFVKFPNGSIPQVRGSSRLGKEVRENVGKKGIEQTWTDDWILWLRLQQARLVQDAATHTCYQTLTAGSAVTPERI